MTDSEKNIETLFADFKKEVEQKGYQLQETEPASEEYRSGQRFAYRLPEHLWTDVRYGQPLSTERPPGTQVFMRISRELMAHAKEFYDAARTAAKKLNNALSTTEPIVTANKECVIYCGLKTQR